MICEAYVLYVCPDPDCDFWDLEPGVCPSYDAHPLGDYPTLRELRVAPPTEVERLRQELRIAWFDAEVPLRELREENERLREAIREARDHISDFDDPADRILAAALGDYGSDEEKPDGF